MIEKINDEIGLKNRDIINNIITSTKPEQSPNDGENLGLKL